MAAVSPQTFPIVDAHQHFWDPRDPIGEMRYVERLRHETGFPNVAVAQAWLDCEDLGATLDALAQP